jgi:hypothetical protein
MTAFRQASSVRATKGFSFTWGARNRRVNVKAGDPFWITNTQEHQRRTGTVCVARRSQSQHYDYAFPVENFPEFFTAE